MLQLHSQDCCLHGVEPPVPTNLLVKIALTATVIAQSAHVLCHGLVVGGSAAGIAVGTQVLGGIETESGGIAPRACTAALPCRSKRLRSIFDQRHPFRLAKFLKFPQVRALSVEMHRQNGAN